MLKVSFSINNIQNTLQRQYHRSQTEKKVFYENHQNNYKRQYGSNYIVLWSKDLVWSKVKIATLLLN